MHKLINLKGQVDTAAPKSFRQFKHISGGLKTQKQQDEQRIKSQNGQMVERLINIMKRKPKANGLVDFKIRPMRRRLSGLQIGEAPDEDDPLATDQPGQTQTMHEHHLFSLQEREPSQTKLSSGAETKASNIVIQRNPSKDSTEPNDQIVSFGFEISPSLHEIAHAPF